MLGDLARVAAYGASASFGRDAYRYFRDAYRYFKERAILTLAVGGALLTALGFRHMVMGHDRGVIGTIFLTIIGSILMIVLGIAFVIPFFFMAAYYVSGSSGMSAAQKTFNTEIVLLVFAGYLVVATAAGLIWGFRSRASRNRAAAVEQHNLAFLEEHGFQDLGLGEGLIEDADGNRLRLKSEDPGQLVFTVIGRRNVRACIDLDQIGRMLNYSGAIRL